MVEKNEFTTAEDHDGISEGTAGLPKGWKYYVIGTLAWMLFYIYSYTPLFSGWTQVKGLD